MRIALDLDHQRTRQLGEAGPGLGKLDFGHGSSTSPDLVTWTLRPQPLLDHGDPALGIETLYRSTGVVEHGTLVVWYAMQTRP